MRRLWVARASEVHRLVWQPAPIREVGSLPAHPYVRPDQRTLHLEGDLPAPQSA